jgi:hypothetical protein
MERQSFFHRAVAPAATVLIVMVVSLMLYNHAWRIGSHSLHQFTAYVSGLLLFVSIGFGPLYVYPNAFFRGASAPERILACLVTPVAWDVKEILRVSEYFSWGESLYYGLNTIFLLCLCVVAAQMGICEMVCRSLRNRRVSAPVPVVTPASLIPAVLGLAGVGTFFLWGGGVHTFYLYQEGYKALFM